MLITVIFYKNKLTIFIVNQIQSLKTLNRAYLFYKRNLAISSSKFIFYKLLPTYLSY